MTRRRPDLARMPFGKQFSPNQVDLRKVLELAHAAAGDCDALEASVLSEYFARGATSEEKLAMNTRIAMQRYGLLDRECHLTEAGEALYQRRDDPQGLYRDFARRILVNLHGAQMVQAIQVLSSQGLPLKAETIAEQLETMGVEAGGRSGEKLNPIRLWLEKAGVFRSGWELDTDVLQQIIGVDTETLDALTGLNPEQRAYATALAGLPDPSGEHISSEVARLAEQQTTIRFDTKQLPKKVLFPLEEAGLITVTKTTAGRGAKPYVVSGTEKMTAEVVGPLLQNLEETASPIDPRSLRRPVTELLAEVRDDSLSTDRRGKALEGVALQLTRALGLRFIAWRRRAHETGGAEVDLIATQSNGRFAVWQIQCKVSGIRSRDVVDREVGVAQSLKSNVIMFVTAGSAGKAARNAADAHMKATGLNIIFLDGGDLDAVAAGRSPAPPVDREFTRVERARIAK